MSSHPTAGTQSRRLTHLDFARMANAGEKIAVLTCYDASFSRLCDAAAVEILLVGDSLGMVLQGHDSTLPVTVDDIAYHTAAVARGAQRALVAADMPWASYQESPAQAYRNAAHLMAGGAQMVKLEGGAEMAETTSFLAQRGIPVWAHVGLTPQYVHTLGGYRVQGRGDAGARVLADAQAHAAAGAAMLLLEAIPAELAAQITRETGIPTIGIGAGKDCSGQVLVLHDMLDVTAGRKARFVRNFMAGQASIQAAVNAYVAAVKDGSFPAAEHCY